MTPAAAATMLYTLLHYAARIVPSSYRNHTSA